MDFENLKGSDYMKRKLTSRKFWVSVATVIASVGTTLSGLQTGDTTIVVVGAVCTAVASGIYTIAEAITDTGNSNF